MSTRNPGRRGGLGRPQCADRLAGYRGTSSPDVTIGTQEPRLPPLGSWRTNLEQVLGRACVFALHGGSQSLMQGRAEQTCGKWRKQNVVAPPRSSAGRPTRWLWSLSRGQLPCDLSFVERLRFDGNPKPNTYEINTALPAVSGHKRPPVSIYCFCTIRNSV